MWPPFVARLVQAGGLGNGCYLRVNEKRHAEAPRLGVHLSMWMALRMILGLSVFFEFRQLSFGTSRI